MRAVAVTAFGFVALALAISAKPGTTLVTVVLAVVFMIVTLFGCALFPSRTVGALVSGGIGLAALVYGLFGSGLGTTRVLLFIGVGVLLVFFGFARVATPLIPALSSLTSPVARWSVFALNILVWPFFAFPIGACASVLGPGGGLEARARVRRRRVEPLGACDRRGDGGADADDELDAGVAGRLPDVVPDGSTLASGVRTRAANPQRTASTAAALMIGLALVTLVATLASGIIKPFTDAVDQHLRRRLRDHGAEQLRSDSAERGEGRGGGAGGRPPSRASEAATARPRQREDDRRSR